MSQTHRTKYKQERPIRVPAPLQATANALFKKHGFGEPFTVPIASPAGIVTHYGCQWTMTEAEWGIVKKLLQSVPGNKQYANHTRLDKEVEKDGMKVKRESAVAVPGPPRPPRP